MWHEQRRTEKLIKGMMVDRRKRAERRQEYYNKTRTDPNQFLQVHGQSMKVHYDPVTALAADAPSTMMPWNGDRQVLIDRFDVRANLDYIPEYNPPKDQAKLDYKEEKEQRNVNYERYRILIQNEYLCIQEEKFLKMIDLEEKYGGTTYQNEKAKAEKKKSANSKAAIGFVYADSSVPEEPEPEPDPSDSDTDSEPDFDLNVDVMALGTTEQDTLNSIGLTYDLGKRDFVKMLAKDVEEAEELRMEKEKDNEKSKLSGKKSRRERKLLKEKMLEGRRVSSPSFAAKKDRSRSRTVSESDSESEEVGEEDKVEFITSFGGDSDQENGSKGVTFKKTKEYKEPIGPTLPDVPKKKKDKRDRDKDRKKSSHRRRSRSRSRHRRRGRSRSRDRSRRKRRDASRGSKSSGRSSLNSREGTPAKKSKEKEEEPEPPTLAETPPPPAEEEVPPISRYAPASNHHPSMLAYPPPPKPDYMTNFDMVEEIAPASHPPPGPGDPGFVPPLPKLPHPDDIKVPKKELGAKKADTSDSSDEEDNKNGYRSKYRNKAASSEDEEAPRQPASAYQASISSFFTGVSRNVASLTGAANNGPKVEPPPVKRYYGRRRENDSDSELSGLDSDSESRKGISHKIKQRVESKTKLRTASKETLAERDKIRKKMQSQLKRTFKEDKKAEQERLKKLEEEQLYKEEEMRELSAKIKEKEREKRRMERSRSKSRSRERRRSRSRTPRSRRRSRSQDRSSKDRRRSRSRHETKRIGGLVDY